MVKIAENTKPVTNIFLSDRMLADPHWSLPAKVISEILRMDKIRGQNIKDATNAELAKMIAVSVATVKRARAELKKKGHPDYDDTTSLPFYRGIFLFTEFLADKSLSMNEKVVFGIIRKEAAETKFTTITNAELAERTCIGKSTIPRILRKLDKDGKIAVVWDNTAIKGRNGFNPTPNKPTTKRYIYLIKQQAGHRKGLITKRRNRLERLHEKRTRRLIGESTGITSKTREEIEAEVDRRHEEECQECFVHSLADMPDELVAALEKDNGVAPGTYLSRKQEYLKRQEGERADSTDLFDD